MSLKIKNLKLRRIAKSYGFFIPIQYIKDEQLEQNQAYDLQIKKSKN